MKLKKSKTIIGTCLVGLRGNKLVRVRKNTTKIFGFYTPEREEITKMYDMNGKKMEVVKKFPEGVAFYGDFKIPVVIDCKEK